MATRQKQIVMIAYYYHPDLEVGAVRSVKFTKYLPESDWRPIIVTVHTKYYQRLDPHPLPFECEVHRTSKWPTQAEIYQWLKSRLRRSSAAATTSGSAPTSSLDSAAPTVSGRPPIWKRLMSALFWIPDYQIGWLVPGTWRAIKLARKYDADVLYNSGPPRTGHLMALLASLATGKPLVVDYRDPLVSLQPPRTLGRKISIFFERWIERRVLKRAALVITTTPEYRDLLSQLYHPLLHGKCHSVINGFDAEDFPQVPEAAPAVNRPIHFLYAGTLYQGRDPRELVVALGALVREGFLRLSEIAVDFYGPVEIDPAPLRQIIADSGLSDVITFRPMVPRRDYLQLIGSADVLVLLQSETTPVQIPAKAFEYLATGGEILVMSQPGSTTKLFHQFPNAHIAAPNDAAEIKERVRAIITRLRSGQGDRRKNLAALTPLHKRELTKEFARLLDAVIERR